MEVNTTGISAFPSTMNDPCTIMPLNGLKRKTHPASTMILLSFSTNTFSDTIHGLPDGLKVMPLMLPEIMVWEKDVEKRSRRMIVTTKLLILFH